MEHTKTIIDQFSKQAIPFTKLPGHLDSIEMLVEISKVGKDDTVLDVACGPGMVACEFAKMASHVTGIDITKKMIEQAKALQSEKSITNISWAVGDVLPLPYDDKSFSIVITRYSFHHFIDPQKVLSEMLRVCKPGGTVMVVDVSLPDDKVDHYNVMEKLRDPSHTKALATREFEFLFDGLPIINKQKSTYEVEVELEAQLKASFPNKGDEKKIRELIQNDIGINNIGVNAHQKNGAVYFKYPISIYVGQKA